MVSEIHYPVREARLILRACNSTEPLRPDDDRWYDFASLRHAHVLERLKKVFDGEPAAGAFHHRLLCGHRGTGKSTELLRFKRWASENGFACGHLEVDIELGHIQLEFSDFFLLAATAAERALEDLGAPLPKDSLKPIVEWFAEVTRESSTGSKSELALEADAQIGGGIPGLGKLMAKLTSGLRVGASHAKTVRQHMRNYPDRLIELTNALLKDAHKGLGKLGRPNGLVLLFDNLDRFDPDEINRVLIAGSNLLNRLGCHALFTIPIDLEYNPRSGPLRDAYGQPVVLPMIPLRRPDDPWQATAAESRHLPEALQGLRRALQQRVVPELFEDIQDIETLVQMSGGCIRDLMHLLTLSYEMSSGDNLSTSATRSAVAELRATYSRELEQSDYERLADIAARRRPPRDELTQRLLYNRWALEYYQESGDVWLDVHPLVIEIEEFQRVFRDRQTVRP